MNSKITFLKIVFPYTHLLFKKISIKKMKKNVFYNFLLWIKITESPLCRHFCYTVLDMLVRVLLSCFSATVAHMRIYFHVRDQVTPDLNEPIKNLKSYKKFPIILCVWECVQTSNWVNFCPCLSLVRREEKQVVAIPNAFFVTLHNQRGRGRLRVALQCF